MSWSALLARIRPHRRTLVLSGVLALFGAAGGLAQPLAAREVIEALADDESLLVPLLVLGGLVAFSSVIVAANFWLLERTSERIVLGTRRELATRLLRLRLSALDGEAPGDLVARATSDSTLLGSVSSTALVQLVMGAITLVASIVLMGVVDLVLLGVTLAVLVVVGGAVALVLPRIMRATERQQEAVGGLGAALERALGGLRTVKASGAEERETRAVTDAAERAYERGMESAGYQAIVGTATGLIVQVAFLAVLGVGGARVASGDMGVGDLIAFLLYLFFLADPISAIAHGYVEQEAPVLAGTLRDNLLYAAPDAGEDALRAVLLEARLEELVARLPDGLDTEIAARGASLWGGERQRIAIARALLRRPALLLLDEAASQLDAVNEMALRDTVSRAGETRAVLAIAHRLSTVVSARRIVVLEAGQVRATGAHAELVQGDALYAELAATQFTAA